MNYQIINLKPFGILITPVPGKEDIKELDIESLRKLFNQEQIIILRGFHTFSDKDDFSSYCESWGEVSLWPFGKVLELIEQENPEDHIFDNNYIPLHWDGMYRPQVPEYQIFHCVKAPLSVQGGRTTFSNTILALEHAPDKVRAQWDKVTGIYEREMEFYNSKVISSIITKHPHRDFSVIRYNEPPQQSEQNFLNPPKLEFTGISNEELEQFHLSLQQALYAQENFYAHEWQEGDVVIADNFSLLHGREEFISKSPRHLQRVQVHSATPFENSGLESYQ